MRTYADYQQEIATLQKEAEQVRRNELQAAKDKIREIMATYQLKLDDLGDGAVPRKRKSSGPVAAKYRDPASGKTWSGRGRQPHWLTDPSDPKFLIQA